MKTVTFGMANAPYIAVRTLDKLARINSKKYPLAAKVIMSSMYVDDVLSGTHSKEELIETYNQLKKVFFRLLGSIHKNGVAMSRFFRHYSETISRLKSAIMRHRIIQHISD